MEPLVNALGPYAQLAFAIVLACGFVWIQWRNSRKDPAVAAEQAVAEKHSEIQTRTDVHFDGPIMAIHRMVTDLTGSLNDLRQSLTLFIETSRLREQRLTEITGDAFRLLRSIEEKAEEASQNGEKCTRDIETLLREFRQSVERDRRR